VRSDGVRLEPCTTSWVDDEDIFHASWCSSAGSRRVFVPADDVALMTARTSTSPQRSRDGALPEHTRSVSSSSGWSGTSASTWLGEREGR